MFIVITVIITCTKKVLLIVAYKLRDLCTTYRQTLCATLVIKFVDILLQIYLHVFQEFLMDKMNLNMSFNSMEALHSFYIIYYIYHILHILYPLIILLLTTF